MTKLLIVLLALLAIGSSNFDPRFPDALRCGINAVDGGTTEGSILALHAYDSQAVHYRQIYNGQDRRVAFKITGEWKESTGFSGTVDGCKNKSLFDLKKEGRAYAYAINLK